MEKLYKVLLVLALILTYNCGSKTYFFGETKHIKSDLSGLSYHEKTEKVENDILTTYYRDFDLTEIYTEKKTEFWLSDKKIIEFTTKSPDSTLRGICHLSQVFKKNFLIISKYDCWAAGPENVKRDNVLIIDLNSSKVYKTDFGMLKLSMSKSYIDYCCENAKDYFAILYIDLEVGEIIIHNNFGSNSFNITPYYKSVF